MSMGIFNASDMKLAAHSDASYLREPKARSRAGGRFFLSETLLTKALKQFKHKLQKKQHQPYPSAPIIYGSKKQYATPL